MRCQRTYPALIVFVMFCAVTPLRVRALPAQRDAWLRVDSPHFVVVSDANEKKAWGVAVALERFRAEVAGPDDPAEADLPTTIIAFDDEKSFRPYNRRPDGKPATYVGIFATSSDGNFIGMSLDPDADPYGTIYHEYVHWLNSKKSIEIPLWLEEGMAEYYSTFRVEDDRIVIGQPVEHHAVLLAVEPMLSFTELFEVGAPGNGPQMIDARSEEERRGMFYAESWALFHYLMLGQPELQPKLRAFLEGWAGSVNPNAAWKSAFGVDYEPVERALREYVRGATFPYVFRKFDDLPAVELRVEPMPYAELLRCLGEYVAHVTPWNQQEALRHLEAAVEHDPANARARAGLGCVLAKKSQSEQAEAQFAQAAKLAPDDGEVWYRWGSSQIARYIETNPQVKSRPDPFPAALQDARQSLMRAIQLNPRRAEAYNDYGCTFLYDPGDPGDGIAALEVARNFMPSRMDVVYNLILLYLRKGDRATAQGLADHVLARSRDPEWSKRAQQALERNKTETSARRLANLYYDAVDKYNAQDFAEALALLDELGPQVTDPEMEAAVRDLRQAASEALEQQREVEAHNRLVEQYNVAIAKGKAGDVAGAIEILERLLPQVKDPAFATRVRETLDQARELAGP